MSAKLNNRCRNYSKDAGESNLNNLIAGWIIESVKWLIVTDMIILIPIYVNNID